MIHRSTAPVAKLKVTGETESGWITFNASQSVDKDGDSCTSFLYDFGDGTPPIAIGSSTSTRPSSQTGIYKISVTVMDKYGQTDKTFITYKVNKSSPQTISFASNTINTLSKKIETLQNQKDVLSIINKKLLTCCEQKIQKEAKKKQTTKPVIQHNYLPPRSLRATGNLRIQRQITKRIIPKRVDVSYIKNLYSYLDKLTALQWNEDDEKYNIGDMKVMDYDLYDKETKQDEEKLYCIIRRLDESLPLSRKYKWTMDKQLYNNSQLQAMGVTRIPKLRSTQCIISMAKDKLKMDEIIRRKLNTKIQSISLSKINIYNKQNVRKNEGMQWVLSAKQFKEYCQNNKNWESILIVMSYEKNLAKCIEYLIIIPTPSDKCDIGISVKKNSKSDSLHITGLHIDKNAILEQHHLAMPYKHNQECNCLDSWNDASNIRYLKIGDVNQDKIDKHRLEQELDTKTEIINTMISVSNLTLAPMIPSPPSYSASNVSTTISVSKGRSTLQSPVTTSQQQQINSNVNGSNQLQS